MAGLAYYARKPYLKKSWQRIGVGLALMTTATAIGTYLDSLVERRYSSFKGRTALYGDTTVRNGWLDSHSKEQLSK